MKTPQNTGYDSDATTDPALHDGPGIDWSTEGGSTENGPATEVEDDTEDE